MKNRNHRAALWYAAHNWYVVPLHAPLFDADKQCIGCTCEAWRRKNGQSNYICRTPGKHPIIRDWENNASISINEIDGWWSRWGFANVGIAAGKSGLLCFDLDSYKDGYEGAEFISRSDEETVTSLTGSGGTHLIYRMPEDAYLTNANAKLPPGIDIRGYGGQFVAPPSIHPSGNTYQWETGYGPHEIEPLPVPAHLLEILQNQVEVPRCAVQFNETLPKPDLSRIKLSEATVKAINSEPEKGKRSETDQSVITALVRAGASDDEIKAIFEHYPIGTMGKYAEKGTQALNYLSHSIAHARGWMRERRVENFFAKAVLS